jgi:hypothetical protein
MQALWKTNLFMFERFLFTKADVSLSLRSVSNEFAVVRALVDEELTMKLKQIETCISIKLTSEDWSLCRDGNLPDWSP